MLPTPASIPFTPQDSNVPSILRALASPAYSLAQIAEACHTSLEALTLWMTTPDIRQQLESTDAIAAWRTGYTARLSLSKSIASLDEILSENLTQRRDRIAQSLTAKCTPTESLRNQIIETRHTESIRRCASLMLRLSRLPAPPLIPTSPPTRHTHPTNVSTAPSPTQSPQTPEELLPSTHLDEPPHNPDHPTHARDERVLERIPRIHDPHASASDITPVSEFLDSPPTDPSEPTCAAPRGTPASEHWP